MTQLTAGTLSKFLLIATNEALTIDRQFRHVSIITNAKFHVIAIGTNRLKTHPFMVTNGYPNFQLHSEVDAFSKLSYNDKRKELLLVNFRLNNDNALRLSKPCKYCLPWCVTVFKEIYFSTENGFKKLDKQ